MTNPRTILFAISVAALLAGDTVAQQACPCVPVTKLWTSTVCDDWRCASAALVSADGDPSVFAVPLGMNDRRWLVIRQVASGGFADNSPFQVESFDGLSEAIARFAAISSEFHPLILSVPDRRLIVLSLREPETRHRATK